MSEKLKETLAGVRVMEPKAAGGLQIFGLNTDGGSSLEYAVLDEALAARRLEVTEISEGGSVPTLKVCNTGDTLVFLMAGEQLVGAKQNRVLNASLLIAAHSTTEIPVSCVERGRWGYRSKGFGSSGSSAHRILRMKMSKSAHAAYRTTGKPLSHQGEVWKEINRKLHAMSSDSATDALEQVYTDHGSKLNDTFRSVQAPEGCRGVVFAFNGQVAGMDLFDNPETLRKLFTKVVRSYAIDAMETPQTGKPLDRGQVETWLRQAAGARLEKFKSPGLGDDIRIESKEIVGASLALEDQPVHVELFPNEE